MLLILLILLGFLHSQTITQLAEITINEELPNGAVVTLLTDKIPHLDQSIEYDLVPPLSSEYDLFSIDHSRQAVIMKKRLDFDELCRNRSSCSLSVSIAVSNVETINVYILPIQVKNIDDHPMEFTVNRTVIELNENDDDWRNKSYPLPRATDIDNDPIEYTVHLHNWNSPDGLFFYDSTTHRLRPLKSFDREEQSVYLLRLVAHQKGHADLSIDVIVLIQDQNDHQPNCSSIDKFIIDHRQSQSFYSLRVTDDDQGENGRLEYRFISPLIDGFQLDPHTGRIRFDPKLFKRTTNQSKLFVNVTDYGSPRRLSTECVIDLEWPYLYEIDFISITNEILRIENLHQPFGHLKIWNIQEQNECLDCSIRLNSSIDDFFYFDPNRFDFYLNLNSMILRRILANEKINEEKFVLNIDVEVENSKKNFSLTFLFNKERIRQISRLIYLNINEDLPLQTRIPIQRFLSSCLIDDESEFIDPTETFDMDDEKKNFIVKKFFNIHSQQYYNLQVKSLSTNRTNQCLTIEFRLTIVNLYSLIHVYPYFSQTFLHLTSLNLSQFILPSQPSYITYRSSRSNEIFIDPLTRTIRFQSPSTSSSEFRLDLFHSQTPSLSSSIAVRLYSSANRFAPRLLFNRTNLLIKLTSIQPTYQIEAIDPDLSFDHDKSLFPPSIEYSIEPMNNELDIDRYTGRLMMKNLNRTNDRENFMINVTLVMTDFGQPQRLTRRENLLVEFHFDDREENEQKREEIPLVISNIFIIIGASLLIIILIVFILILVSREQSKKKIPLDTRLIDHEYGTSSSRQQQRIYPSVSFDRIQIPSLPESNIPPKSHLSINEINKYLERFEKIYNNSSSEQTLHDPIGSVV